MARLSISLQSLIIQCAAMLLAALLFAASQFFFSVSFSLWQVALAQGVAAAGLSWLGRQPVWWLFLHFVFLPAIVLAQALKIPAWVYLLAFLVLVLFYWSSFRTRVPLFLSDLKAWQALASLLPQSREFRFIDLGSGLGDVLFYLEAHFPQGRFYGAEIAPAPWLISRMRAWSKRSRVNVLRRDYTALNLAEFDVVFAFLSPAAMPALWQQAQQQMRKGALFISLSFAVPRPPDHVIKLAEGERHTLYAWQM